MRRLKAEAKAKQREEERQRRDAEAKAEAARQVEEERQRKAKAARLEEARRVLAEQRRLAVLKALLDKGFESSEAEAAFRECGWEGTKWADLDPSASITAAGDAIIVRRKLKREAEARRLKEEAESKRQAEERARLRRQEEARKHAQKERQRVAELIPPGDLLGKRVVVYSDATAAAGSSFLSCAMERDETFVGATAAPPPEASKGIVKSFTKGTFLGIGPSKHTVVFDEGPRKGTTAPIVLCRHGNGGLVFEVVDLDKPSDEEMERTREALAGCDWVEVSASELVGETQLGEGGFGIVTRVTCNSSKLSGVVMARKKLQGGYKKDEANIRRFLVREVRAMAAVKHFEHHPASRRVPGAGRDKPADGVRRPRNFAGPT